MRHPDAQSDARIAILKRAYEAFNRGDMATAVEAMDPQVEWIEPAEFPGGDQPYHGPNEVKGYLAQSRAGWIEGRSEPEQFLASGAKVAVFVHARFRSKGDADHWTDVRLADVYTFRGDVIVAMHAFADRRDALKYAGIESRSTEP